MNPNDKSKKGTKSLNNNNRTLNMSQEDCSNLFLVLLKKKLYYLNCFELMWAKCEQLNPKAIY